MTSSITGTITVKLTNKQKTLKTTKTKKVEISDQQAITKNNNTHNLYKKTYLHSSNNDLTKKVIK